METLEVVSKKEMEENKSCDDMTNEEAKNILLLASKQKYCPNINEKCKGHGCAFFVIDRPFTDKHYIEARCTFAGNRPIEWLYGTPNDIDPETMQ